MSEIKRVSIRLVDELPLYSEEQVSCTEDVVKIVGKELAGYDREVLCVLNLNNRGQVINMNIASMGTINQSLVAPREIFKSAILSNACGVILMHNHPSGSLEPSRQDIRVTKRLQACGELLGIEVADHVIIGGGTEKSYSFREAGIFDDIRHKMADLFSEPVRENTYIQRFLQQEAPDRRLSFDNSGLER